MTPNQHVEIETRNNSERELLVKKTLEEVLVNFPCPIFTTKVIIETKVIPHSHPVLTINTRLTDPLSVLNVFVHEQFHWFAQTHPRYNECIEYLKKYPDLGDCNKSGTYPNSFWEHLIVNWNMRNFLNIALSKEQFGFVYGQWTPYPLTEKFVEEHFDTLMDDLKKFDMVYSIHLSPK